MWKFNKFWKILLLLLIGKLLSPRYLKLCIFPKHMLFGRNILFQHNRRKLFNTSKSFDKYGHEMLALN